MSVATAPDRAPARPARRSHTLARTRVWMLSVSLTAVALLATTSLLMSKAQDQVRVIGTEAVPLAATASDLYFALSDLDAQIARLVLINNAEALSSSQLDALSTYRERSLQIDTDLATALTIATSGEDRATVAGIVNDLGRYRQWAWQALAVERQAASQTASPPADEPPPAALGYYAQATNVMHFDLLPAVKRLRDTSQDRLDQAYADQRITQLWSIGLVVLLGVALAAQLAVLQAWLVKRFRRWLNPPLLAATLLAVGLTVSAGWAFAVEGQRLNAAYRDHLVPYLALATAQAISYDAAADTSRYLLSANEAYQHEFARKSECLVSGGPCGTSGEEIDGGLVALAVAAGTTAAQAEELRDRWLGYQDDHDRIVGLAGSGQTAEAIATFTGIRRGEAAFDLYYFDTAISELAAVRKQAFDRETRAAEGLLTGWPAIPVVVIGIVLVLVPLGLWPRLAEYR